MNVANGAHVLEGDLHGIICDPFGETMEHVTSPIDGYIIGLNNMPVVNEGDALIHLGTDQK